MRRPLGWCALALVLAGCQPSGSPQVTVSANDPHAAQQAEMEKSGLDLSQVVVVRLSNDGKRVEVTSVLPAVIAETTLSGQAAKTIFRVNETRDGLILFSRDLLKSTSYRTEVKFAEMETKQGLTFPVVQADGSLQEQTFALAQIVRPAE